MAENKDEDSQEISFLDKIKKAMTPDSFEERTKKMQENATEAPEFKKRKRRIRRKAKDSVDTSND